MTNYDSRKSADIMMRLGAFSKTKNPNIRGFLGEVTSSYAKVLDVIDAVNADESRTKEARILTISDRITAEKQRLARARETLQAEAVARIKRLDESLRQSLAPQSSGFESRAAELRSVIRSMKREERDLFIRDAIMNDDVAVLRAVASVHPSITGAIPIHVKEAREKVFKHDAPEAYAERVDTVSALHEAQEALSAFSEITDRFASHGHAETIRENRQRADEAIAATKQGE